MCAANKLKNKLKENKKENAVYVCYISITLTEMFYRYIRPAHMLTRTS